MEKEYNTKQKSFVLETLKEHKDETFTSDELSKMLLELGFKVSRATLFRSLKKFIKTGEVKKFYKDNSSYYQYVQDVCIHEDHVHLVCTECGKLIHADIDTIKKVDKEAFKKYGFDISDEKTMLYGVCNDCKENRHEENN